MSNTRVKESPIPLEILYNPMVELIKLADQQAKDVTPICFNYKYDMQGEPSEIRI